MSEITYTCTKCGSTCDLHSFHDCPREWYPISTITKTGNEGDIPKFTSGYLNVKPLFKVRVKCHSENVVLKKISQGDWIDLCVVDRHVLSSGEYKLLSFGFSMQLPNGYEAHVIPRSSTFKKFGILQANSMGLIDNSYCGDNDIWMFPAYATKDTIIEVGERIAQFRIVEKQPDIEFEFVDSLGNDDRGGFGSTDTKKE